MMARSPQSDTASESGGESKAPFREKINEELIEFAILTVYLYVCFAAVTYFKAAVLQAQGIAYDHLGLAIIKAELRAKFMLVGRAVHIGERFRNLPLIVPTRHKSFVFLLLLVVLTLIEEIVVGAIHGETIMHSVSGNCGRDAPSVRGDNPHHVPSHALLCVPIARADQLATKYWCGYSSSAVTATDRHPGGFFFVQIASGMSVHV